MSAPRGSSAATLGSMSRLILPWVAVVLLSLAAGYAAIEVTRISLEHSHKTMLSAEVKRRSFELMAVTMNGNVMGAVTTLGLVNYPIKQVARGEVQLEDKQVMEVLRSVGEKYQATGVYVVDRSGVIRSNWYTTGKSLTGVDVKFRPYFQIAMQGKQNVYAAIGTTTGQRGLYFAAPLYDAVSGYAPVIGAAVARLDVERIDSVLRGWPGPALLLSPQQIAFASTYANWIERIAGEITPQRLQAIRKLKQFGNAFEGGTPQSLPFDPGSETVSFDYHRYAVERASVQWNDPQGEWTLVLLSDLDDLMPASRRTLIGTTSAVLVLLLGALYLVWRRRLQHVEEERQRAKAELQAHTHRLELDSTNKSLVAEVSADLQRANSLAEFAGKFLYHVAPRVNADYGVFYVLVETSGPLIPVAAHGALAEGLEPVALGQGLVGQCAKDLAPIVISEPAEDTFRIVWGAGVIAPKAIVLLPVVQTGHLLGVVVLATLHAMDADKRTLLDAMMPTVAMSLEILRRNLGTQQQAELLQETEAWYRGIVESAPDGMLVMDEQGVITLTNPQIDAMFGYASGALRGQKIEVLVPQDVRSRHPGLREGFIRSGGARAIRELHGVRQDGSEFPVEVGLSVLPALGGQGLCVCASVRDISERRARERELSDTMTLQQAIFSNVPVGIILTADGLIRRVNPRLAEILGSTEEALLGQPGSAIWPTAEAYAAFGARAAAQFAQGMPVSEEVAFLRIDGGKVVCHLSGRAITISGYSRAAIWVLEDITERKQSEERLRQVLEDSPAAVTMVEEDGTHIFSNHRLAEMLGVPRNQMQSRRTTEFWAEPEKRSAFLGRLKADGRVDDYEVHMRRDDGQYIWVLLNTRWVELGGQRLLLSWMYDITERKQAEESIRLANEEQNAIFESATVGIAFIKDRVIVRCNSKLNELFGYGAEEQIGQSTRIWYPSDEAYAAGGGSVYEALAQGKTHQREQLLQHKNGSQFWCSLSGRAVDASDLARGTVWMLEDITSRKQSDVALHDQFTLQQALVDAIPYPIFYKGPDTRFLGFNRAYEETFGVRREDLIGKRVLELDYLPKADRAAYQQEDEETIASAGKLQKEIAMPFADGKMHDTIYYVAGFRKSDGSPGGLVGTFIDVSDRKKVEDLERFNRLALGREERIVELKKEVNALAQQAGRGVFYASAEQADAVTAEVAAPVPANEKVDDFGTAKEAFVQLVQREQLQELFNGFCESVGIAAAIIDLEAKVLASSRWQRVCTDFHRVNERSCANCIESDTGLALKLEDGADFTMYKCKNGMTDCAAPIIVDGHHVANVFIGQFHLQKPDLIFFRKQAGEFGFDADKYVAAVEEAPVMDEAKLPHILGYLARFAHLIGSFAVEQRRAVLADHASAARGEELRRERLAAFSLAEDAENARSKLADYQAGLEQLVAERTRELEKTAAEVRESEKRLRGILETSPVCIAFSTKGVIHFANSLFIHTFGAKVGQPSPQLYVNQADRDDLIASLKRDGIVEKYELKMYDSERRERDMLVTYLPINYEGEEGILGWLLDISERKQAEDELKERLADLERFGRLTVDREEKMMQLKEEINSLLEQAGKEARYKIVA